MPPLPTGTVTFLFTDIEGSTRLVQRLGDAWKECHELHARLLREAMAAEGGIEVAERGDGFFYVFPDAVKALRAASAAQRALAGQAWPPEATVRVRMGLHTGLGVPAGDNYQGLDVNRAARIGDAGHGGQVLLSGATAELVRDHLPPGLALRDLGRHGLKDLPRPEPLHQLVLDGLPDAFPPLRTLGSAPVRLPLPLTSFVGRQKELREILAALEGTRLLTLTGPGGTGKTRLALQAAAEAAPGFPDGVCFVPLASITDPALAAPTVISALQLPESPDDPARTLGRYLEPRRLLLVMDNLEQILEIGPQAAEWLRRAPGLKVLATSRAPLHLSGEQEYPVPPLQAPRPAGGKGRVGPAPGLEELARNEAVALFTARAAAARPGFSLTAENAATVAEITARLDGLPLAIELAAARVKLFPPEAVLARLSSRLAFLSAGARDLPPRQRTLQGAIDWSHDLLDGPSRRLFRRLAVFVDGATIGEAEAVCGPAEDLGTGVLDGLEALADQSLIRQVHTSGEPRFAMLETVREYARRRLEESGERDLVEARHDAAFLALAEEAEPHLTRSGRCAWLDRLEEELGNLRAALTRAIERGEAGTALRMAGALWRFWQTRGHVQEGRALTAAALRLPGGGEPASRAGEPANRAGEPANRIRALWGEGGMAYWQADMAASAVAYLEALELARRPAGAAPDRRTLALALYNAAFPVGMGGDQERAMAMLEEGLALARGLDDPALLGEIYWGIGTLIWFRGEQAASETWYDRALEALAGTDSVFTIGWSLRQRGVARLFRGDRAAARSDLQRALAMFRADRDVPGVVVLLRDFADLSLADGEPERALRLAGAAVALQTTSETGILEFAQNQIPGLAEAPEAVGRERAEELLAEGRAMDMEQAIDCALHPA